ncbi:MAG: hypothetical protein O3B42_07915 [Actinomycetota bacterium]|nr:hypothetical protein [Actinomycetota bacterium]
MTFDDESKEFAAEVASLHRFFEEWFNGSNRRAIEEFSDRLDQRFTIVAPTGEVSDCDTIVERVRRAAGTNTTRISTRDATLSYAGPVMLGSYIERHESGDTVTERLATVAIVRDNSIPTGFRWLLVHETWIEPNPRI